ncbi:MAG TPA: STAS domain-containing protein [Terriglobales bacterium]|nr:STAS domain-containing protein [Terriglobales bacterium]
METMPVRLKVDGKSLVYSLQEAGRKLDSAESELVLDFSCVRRIDPRGLTAMKELADAADAKAIKLELYGVGIDVYRVLKLMKQTHRFGFVTGNPSARH